MAEVPVWAGINANTFRNYTAIMKRALGLHEAHVDGIFFFESNQFCAAILGVLFTGLY